MILPATLILGLAIFLVMRPKDVGDYAQCVSAGGFIQETYPETCLYNKKSFTNHQNDKEDEMEKLNIIGQPEDEVLERLNGLKIPVRVIWRDGKDLPATMDYRVGRYNLSVEDGKIKSFVIEGDETKL